MLGDKLVIEPYHTDRAAELCEYLFPTLSERFCISVAGESGAGKSEVAQELARLFKKMNIKAGILQQDDYFIFPPSTNHEMRRRNLAQVGPYEVKLDFLSSNIRSFKRNESPIFKPLVNFDENRITTEELDTSDWKVLIAEGTYTSLLQFVDFRVFIDRDYHQTLEDRKRRARDKFEPFVLDVLEIEHNIIAQHKDRANAVIHPNFNKITFV